jgi:ABC-type uncharacterized transport system substrate-binding protein
LPDAIIVSGTAEFYPYRQLIVELVEKSRLPAMYPYREYAEAGGLMAYGTDLAELWRRIADDLHQVLNGATSSPAAEFVSIVSSRLSRAMTGGSRAI